MTRTSSAERDRRRAPDPAERRGLIARVQICRKELALEEDSYRAVLRRITGFDSAKLLAVDQLAKVVAEFERLGCKPAFRPSAKAHVRKVWACWGALKDHVESHSAEALRAFVERQTGVADPEWLSPAQANKVVEGLKAWLRREEANHAG